MAKNGKFEDFILEPTPHEEASDVIRNKPVVTKEVFDRLSPELKAMAFTITGIESADTLQKVRNIIAEFPRGENWDETKSKIMKEISPFFSPKAAAHRAELLLRHHGLTAYRVGQWEMAQETKDFLPYFKYIATMDSRTRPSHAALHGLVLPVDDPFWDTHMPPGWAWMCRCQVVQIAEYEMEEQREAEKKLPKWRRRVLDEKQIDELHKSGIINTGPASNIVLEKPNTVSLKSLRFPKEEILKRYETDEAKEQFLKSLENVKLSDYEGNFTARDWFEGKALPSLKKHIPSERELRNLRFLPISNIEREDKKIEKLTTKERNAVIEYTGDAYHDINGGLRAGNLKTELQECVKNIRSGISKGKLTRDTKLYRNLHPLPWMCNNERLLNMFLSGNLDEKGIGILDTTLKDVIGVKINDPAFTSTSYDGYKHIFGPVRCEVLVHKNSSALSLKTISKHSSENEVLLQSDLVFEVKDVMIEKRGKHNGILFTLEVIEEKKYD